MRDAYWDELGIAWCAVHTGADVVPRLRSHLRRQSLLVAAYLGAGGLLGVACVLLGAFTLWRGWTGGAWHFVTRGTALLAVSAILAIAILGLLPVRTSDQARTLPDMIDLTIARAERLLMTVRLGVVACAILAAFGLAGTAIRTYYGKPPALSPLLDLAILAILALGLLFYGRSVAITLRKFQYLKDVLARDEASPP